MSKRKATKTMTPIPSANGRKILRELMGLILLFFGLYLTLSLMTFDARDPGFNHAISTTKGVFNSAGIIGCYLGGLLTDIFGIAAYIWPILFLLLAARQLFYTFSVQWWRCLGFICLLLCIMMAGTAWDFTLGDIKGGGFIGDAIYGVSWKFLSAKGSLLLGLCFFLISIQLICNISWLALLRGAWLWIVSCWTHSTDPDTHGDDDPKPRQKLTQSQKASSPHATAVPSAERRNQEGRQTAESVHPTEAQKEQAYGHDDVKNLHPSTASDVQELSEKKGFFAHIQQAFAKPVTSSSSDKHIVESVGAEEGIIHSAMESGADKGTLPEQSASLEPNYSVDEGIFQGIEPENPNPFAAPWARACDIQAEWATPSEQEAHILESTCGLVASTGLADMSNTATSHAQEEGKGLLVGPNGGLIVEGASHGMPDFTNTQEDFLFDSVPVDIVQYEEKHHVQEAVSPDNSMDSPSDYEIELDATMAIQLDSPEEITEESPEATAPMVEVGDEDFCFDEPDIRESEPDVGENDESQWPDAHVQNKDVPSSSFEVLMDADKDGITDLTEEEVGTGGAAKAAPVKIKTTLPHLSLLQNVSFDEHTKPRLDILTEKGGKLTTCLSDFGIHGELTRITPGPVVTMFEFRPAPGIKVSRIANLSDDLALALKAIAVRIQAPIPGTDTVGIEIPNEQRETIYFKDLLASQTFHDASSLLTLAVGKDSAGRPSVADLAKMPHLLVAGATGAGKSVCLNSILLSFLYKARPEDVQLLLIDPKRIELAVYADLPHLVHPVVTDMSHAKNALDWAVHEMDKRYEGMARLGVRNIAGYNQKLESFGDAKPTEFLDLEFMPYLVIIIDELADLMLTAAKEVETSIVRLAQLARAAGIHMVLATQRPSVDVVTGIIKANFPCRISFQVTSKHDSRTILDTVGAEHLLGRGDMLFKPSGGRLQRLHGAFVSDDEVANVVQFWKRQQAPMYRVDFAEWGNEASQETLAGGAGALADDPMYNDAVEFVLTQGRASISLVQRRLRIGFNKAARYVEQMEQDGLIGPADGSKPRPVIKGRET